MVMLPNGESFRPIELAICPLCGHDYKLGTGEPLYCEYNQLERVVTVCPTCADQPPDDYEPQLTEAIDKYPWFNFDEEELWGSVRDLFIM